MKLRVPMLALCFTGLVFADGGAILLRKASGPLIITVFTAPADLSVLVQNADDMRVILDADVGLTLSRPGHSDITIAATPVRATNKLLYAAHSELPSKGVWHLTVSVKSRETIVSVEGIIDMASNQLSIFTYWPYLAIVPLTMLLFAANQRLKRKQ